MTCCPTAGVAALIDGRQIAVFRVGDSVYALDNCDPHSDANVLSRGLVGDVQGEPVVASPIYKHHFSLVDRSLPRRSPSSRCASYPARVTDGRDLGEERAVRAWLARAGSSSIGNGMAGMKVVEELLEIAPKAYDITVFGAEPHPNYNRILLSPVLAGEKRVEDIILNSLEWYREKGVHAARRRSGRGDRSRTARRAHAQRRRSCRTTGCCSPPAPSRSCCRCPATISPAS